jgi:hypothetical protein
MFTNSPKSLDRRMLLRQLVTGALASTVVVSAARADISQPGNVPPTDPSDQVDQKIGQIIRAGRGSGFTEVVANERGVMYVGDGPGTFKVRLQRGYNYRFSARGDNDVLDLDLVLYRNGVQIKADRDNDNTPSFDWICDRDGVYTVQLDLVQCKARRAHIGAAVLLDRTWYGS